MTNTILPRLSEATFIELILYDDLRAELMSFLAGADDEVRSTAALMSVVAKKCDATADQLREAIEILEKEDREEADHVLLDLLFHPSIPEEVLMSLVERGKFTTPLSHRSGPREMLEILAERHRCSEAITTLALRYYGKPNQPAKAFKSFVEKYEDVPELEYNLVHAEHLDRQKREIVGQIFLTTIGNATKQRDGKKHARRGRKR